MQVFVETRRPKNPDPAKPLEEQWITTTAKNQHKNYCSKFKEVNGDASDPLTSPFDPKVAMLAGQGKLNGRPYIGGASFDSSGIPSLAEIRARRTSSAPEIERRPRVGLDAIAAMEAEVERNRNLAAEATARAQAAEENNKQMHSHMSSQQACLQALMSRMPADSSLPPLPPLPPLVAPLLLLEHRSAGSHTPTDGQHGGNGGGQDGGNGGGGAASPSSAPTASNNPE